MARSLKKGPFVDFQLMKKVMELQDDNAKGQKNNSKQKKDIRSKDSTRDIDLLRHVMERQLLKS